MSAVMEQPVEKPAKPETDAQEMQALTSSSSGNNTSTGGPDSDAGSVDELPVDDKGTKLLIRLDRAFQPRHKDTRLHMQAHIAVTCTIIIPADFLLSPFT